MDLDERLQVSLLRNKEKLDRFREHDKNMKLGIMGGTFSPIHNAHLATAEFVKDMFYLDKVIFIPAGNPPHKRNILDKRHRFNMAVLSTLKNDDFFVSDYEINMDVYSYTVDTLRYIKSKYPNDELYFITGSDAVNKMYTWKNFEDNFKLAKFITCVRPGISIMETQDRVERYRQLYNADIEMIYVPSLEISSTYIRSRVESGKSIKYLVPSRVEEYICDNDLYGGVNR